MKESTRKALLVAAERIGANNYRKGLADHVRKGRKPHTFRPSVSPIHQEIIEALNADADDDSAMALLHTYDADAERFGP